MPVSTPGLQAVMAWREDSDLPGEAVGRGLARRGRLALETMMVIQIQVQGILRLTESEFFFFFK